MTNVAYINSKFIDFNNAKIHIEDRGFQFADSVYEVFAVFNKKIIDSKFHFMRLKFSLGEIEISYEFSEKKLENIFNKLIKKNYLKNGIIYLQVTRGVQSRDHAFKNNIKPTLVIYTKKKNFNLPGLNFKGVKVVTYSDLRWARRDIKTTNLLPNILAENFARKKIKLKKNVLPNP